MLHLSEALEVSPRNWFTCSLVLLHIEIDILTPLKGKVWLDDFRKPMNSVIQLYSKPRLGVGFELFANRKKYLYREDEPMSQRNIFLKISVTIHWRTFLRNVGLNCGLAKWKWEWNSPLILRPYFWRENIRSGWVWLVMISDWFCWSLKRSFYGIPSPPSHPVCFKLL